MTNPNFTVGDWIAFIAITIYTIYPVQAWFTGEKTPSEMTWYKKVTSNKKGWARSLLPPPKLTRVFFPSVIFWFLTYSLIIYGWFSYYQDFEYLEGTPAITNVWWDVIFSFELIQGFFVKLYWKSYNSILERKSADGWNWLVSVMCIGSSIFYMCSAGILLGIGFYQADLPLAIAETFVFVGALYLVFTSGAIHYFVSKAGKTHEKEFMKSSSDETGVGGGTAGYQMSSEVHRE